MDLNDYIGGDYITPKDVKETQTWVIKDLKEVEFEGIKKAQITLENKGNTKALTLNATNTKRLIQLFGPMPKDVNGKIIVLKLVEVDYRGESYEGIRIDIEATKKAQK